MKDFSHIPQLKSRLEAAKHIVILTHYNPDGDAIGSSVAWYDYLKSLGKDAQIIVPNDFPPNLKWIKGAETVLIANQNLEKAEAFVANADLMLCNDFQSFSRIDKLTEIAQKSTAFKVLVDHHIQPEVEQFDLIFSDTEVSSTAEMVYELLTRLTPERSMPLAVAEAIYVGIMTDTGSFSYSCKHKETFEIVAKLVGLGVDAWRIHQEIYDTFSEDRLRLLGHCLFNRLKVLPEFATAYMYLTKEDLRQYNYVTGDTEGVVNYALSMKNVEFAAFFTERENRIRISFRSKGKVNCNEFAKSHFEGGGHHNASGGNSFVGIRETIENFEKLLPEMKQKNNL